MKTNIRFLIYTLNGTVWYLFFLVWSSISCFRPENVSYKQPTCVAKVKSQPYLGCFQNTHSKRKMNIRLWMYRLNGTVWYPFCLVWSSISCFKPENVSYISILIHMHLFTQHFKNIFLVSDEPTTSSKWTWLVMSALFQDGLCVER